MEGALQTPPGLKLEGLPFHVYGRYIQMCQRRNAPALAMQAYEEGREICGPYSDRVYGHMIQMCVSCPLCAFMCALTSWSRNSPGAVRQAVPSLRAIGAGSGSGGVDVGRALPAHGIVAALACTQAGMQAAMQSTSMYLQRSRSTDPGVSTSCLM